ncbi:MAG: glycosyltransferase [Acidimicrobiia bacterium]|nr:glycosyltransferase [Acidimicrobiia bacterium]
MAGRIAILLMYIVFVGTELDPVRPGGAGTVVARLASQLGEAGHRVEVLIVGSPPEAAPSAGIPVTWIEPGVPDRAAPTQHLADARAAAEAVAGLPQRPDLVEFEDFHGLGLWALMRRGMLALDQTPIAIRAHGPLDLVLTRLGSDPDHLRLMRTMEREAYRMADAVIAPSPAMAEVLIAHFGLEPDRVRIGQPPLAELVRSPRIPAPAPEIVGYGRLGEEKGSEGLLLASLPLLEAYDQAIVRFVGPDGWDVETGASVSEHLRSLVPEHLQERVRFEGPIDRSELGAQLASAWLAVFPTRFETFCYAAHECRSLGLPIIVPQHPEFRPFFGYRTGARFYDGTTEDLGRVIGEVVSDPGMREAMARAPLPSYSDPLEPYYPVVPRHRRTQSGLATAALRRIEAATNPPAAVPPVRFEWADRLLDGLPEAVADRLAATAVDSPAFRRWRRRRAAGSWERETMQATWRGSLPELSDPVVSIVIPCFNQGQFLHEAIRSIFRQSFPSWEIVIVDDGSTDPATRAVLRSLHYPRTRIIRQRNRGLPAARNAGMTAARGRYLVPLDADDELTAPFLAATVEALDRNPEAAFAHTWTRLFGNQDLIWIDRPYNPYQLLLSTSVVGCALIRTEAWRSVGGYDTSRRQGNEDWDLWIRFFEAGWDQVEVPRALFRYRQHGISMSVSTEARFEEARLEIARSHPALYDRTALREMKARWYPWVSVVIDDRSDLSLLEAQTLDDLEIVTVGPANPAIGEVSGRRGWPLRPGGRTLASAVHAAHGKFLIDWRPVEEAGNELLEELAALLEDDLDAYAAGVESGRHPMLWRRWSLLDPAAGPDRLAKAGTRGSGPVLKESDYLGAFPHTRWAIDERQFHRPVHRVRPETEGRFPDWLP